jgi:hypothetical protein
MARATAVEVKERTAIIKQKILNGSSNSVCIDFLRQEGVSRAQAYRYVKSAWSEIRQDIEGPNTERVDFIAWAVHTLQATAGDAVRRGQGSVAVGAIRELSILLGLSNPNTPRNRHFRR